MTLDVVLLLVGGVAAIGAGGLVAVLSPGRFVSAIAGIALGSLGLVLFGFARAVHELATWGRGDWFGYSLALALPASALWLLLAVTLGPGRTTRTPGGWRFYLVLQAALSAAVAVVMGLHPHTTLAGPSETFYLRGLEPQVLCLVLLNLILAAAKLEATYLALGRRHRVAFRPALIGALVYTGFFAYVILAAIVMGRIPASDLSLSSAPVTLLALLLPISMIRGGVGQMHVTARRLPVTATASLMIATAFVGATALLLWMTRAAGISLGRGLFLIAIGGLIAGLGALTVSNRMRRRLEMLLDPIWYEPRAARRIAAERPTDPLDAAADVAELCRLIPANARSVADVDPVTLFLADRSARAFRSVASTLDPAPALSVAESEPLALELRRAVRPFRLRERADDMEYVGIYVENGEQLAACRAVCAAPIRGEDGLIGFLLCGGRNGGSSLEGESLVLLSIASKSYGPRLDKLMPAGPFGPV